MAYKPCAGAHVSRLRASVGARLERAQRRILGRLRCSEEHLHRTGTGSRRASSWLPVHAGVPKNPDARRRAGSRPASALRGARQPASSMPSSPTKPSSERSGDLATRSEERDREVSLRLTVGLGSSPQRTIQKSPSKPSHLLVVTRVASIRAPPNPLVCSRTPGPAPKSAAGAPPAHRRARPELRWTSTSRPSVVSLRASRRGYRRARRDRSRQ